MDKITLFQNDPDFQLPKPAESSAPEIPDEFDFLSQKVGAPPAESAAPVAPPDFDFGGAEFFGDLSDLDQMEEKIVEAIDRQGKPRATPTTTAKKISQDDANLISGTSAAMFVETMDFVLPLACQMIAQADSSAPYEMDPKKKEQLTRITANYFESINFQGSPGTFFALAWAGVVAGPVFKAYQDRKETIKIKAFNAARNKARQNAINNTAAGQQASFFDETDRAALTRPAKRTRFENEDGFYIYTAPGAGKSEYLKKSERVDAVPASVANFFREFESEHGRKPTNKEVETYVLTL